MALNSLSEVAKQCIKLICIKKENRVGYHFMLTLNQPIGAVVSILSSRQDRQTLWEQAQVYQLKMSEEQLSPLCPSSALS